MGNWRVLLLASLAIICGSAIVYGQSHKGKLGSSFTGGGGTSLTPGGASTTLQFNTNGTFGGISTVTSDSANVGFATSSQLILYGFSVGDCVKIGASNQLADSGGACGGSGAPGGLNTQVQFNTNGTFGGVTGAISTNASVIAFSTNSLVINGQAISGVSGTTGTLATVTGSLSTNCVKADGSGNLVDAGTACGGTSATNIAAGSNITTSGTTSNVTVNVVATPTFTSVTSTVVGITGWLTAPGANLQTATIGSFSAPTQCVQATNGILAGTGVACASQTSTPSIAAGTNITTSGTAANTTVNVVATPSFTSVIASGDLTAARAQFTGFLTASGANLQTATIVSLGATTQCLQSVAGVITGFSAPCATQVSTPSIAAGTNITTSGTAANTTVNVVATPSFTTVIASQNLTAATAQFAGFLTAGGASISGLNLATGTMSGNLTGTTHNLSGNLTAGTAQFTGAVTGTTAVFQTITDALLGGCLNATSGVISSTGVSCATQTSTPSIAAGTNITTSGTAANTTINLVATPSVTTLIASGNLTAATAQFSGFVTAGGASLSGLTIVTETLSGNLTGTTANFSGNLTGTTAQFTGAVTGTSAQFQTYTGSTANLTGNLTGSTAQFSGAVTGTTATWQTDTAGFLTLSQFVNWGGESRMSANPFLTVTVGTLTPSGLSINVAGGRNYSVEADLYIGTSINTGGFQMALSGTGGWSNVNYFGYVVDGGSNNSAAGASNPVRGAAIATTKTTAVANGVLSGPNGYAKLSGTITTVNAGTIQVWVAQNTANATHQLTITQGSRLFVHDMP